MYFNASSAHIYEKMFEKTKKIIEIHSIINALNNADSLRKNENVKVLPPRCIWNKQKNAFAINKHPHCAYKLFSIKKYGNEEAAKNALLMFYTTLPKEIIPIIETYSDSE